MIPRFNSSLSVYPLYRNARGLVRKHTRVSILAAAAVAAGGLGTAAAVTGTTPWSAAAGGVAASTHIASGVATGHAGTSTVDAVAGVKAPAKAVAHAAPAQLDSSHAHAPATAGHAQAPTAALAMAQAPAGHAPAAKAQPIQPRAVKLPAAPAKPAAPVRSAAPAKPAAPRPAAAPATPYTIYDSVTPGSIPQGQQVATYANGNYAAQASAVAGRSHVLWIDTNGSDPRANVLDVEPGDSTPAGAASWVQARLSGQPHSVAIVYTMLSEWPSVKSSISSLPAWMQGKVRYWIADPTGVPHVVAGSAATQWYWGNNYDITTANPNFQQG